MGHRVPNHKSKCRNLHGHSYLIELGCDDKVISEAGSSSEGMVIDFSDMKEVLMDVIDKQFDHGFVMYDKDDLAYTFEMIKSGLIYSKTQRIHDWDDLGNLQKNYICSFYSNSRKFI
jgi:6-pyruvoyltetrahydropterin/6-carboxytetrahydropterin synthase